MKSQINLKLGLTLCIFFLLMQMQVQAQKASLSNFLIGEWIMHGPSSPKINDTITLTKELLNKTNSSKWTFSVPKKLIINHYYKKEKIEFASENVFEWNFDIGTNIVRIHGDRSDQYFKIFSNKDPKILKLICVK
jgi:hypothetical protein